MAEVESERSRRAAVPAGGGSVAWRVRLLTVVGLAVAGASTPLFLREWLSLQGLAYGSDPNLWLLSSRNLWVGATTLVPPFYPLLVSLLDRLRAFDLIPAGLALSFAFAVLVPPMTWLAARSLGAGRWAAAIAALVVVMTPDIAVFGVQTQPDSMITLMLVATVPLLMAWTRRPNWWRFGVVAVWAGVLSLSREHGLLLAALIAGFVALPKASVMVRGLRVGAVVGAVLLAPALVHSTPGLPTAQPWMWRVTMTTTGQENIPIYGNTEEQLEQMAHQAAHEKGDRLAVVYHHARGSFTTASTAWCFVGFGLLGCLALPRRRRLAAVLPVLTALPAIAILTQPRHLFVTMPADLAIVAACATLAGRWPRRLAAAALGVSAVLAGLRWQPFMPLATQNAANARAERRAGEALCREADADDLVFGELWDLLVYCPLRMNLVLEDRTAADWRTWVLGYGQPVGNGWTPAVALGDNRYAWRYRVDVPREQRPCPDSVPDPSTPFLALPTRPASLVPPCDE